MKNFFQKHMSGVSVLAFIASAAAGEPEMGRTGALRGIPPQLPQVQAPNDSESAGTDITRIDISPEVQAGIPAKGNDKLPLQAGMDQDTGPGEPVMENSAPEAGSQAMQDNAGKLQNPVSQNDQAALPQEDEMAFMPPEFEEKSPQEQEKAIDMPAQGPAEEGIADNRPLSLNNPQTLQEGIPDGLLPSQEAAGETTSEPSLSHSEIPDLQEGLSDDPVSRAEEAAAPRFLQQQSEATRQLPGSIDEEIAAAHSVKIVSPQPSMLTISTYSASPKPEDPNKPEDPTEEGDRKGGSHKGQKLQAIPIIKMGEMPQSHGGFKVIKVWGS